MRPTTKFLLTLIAGFYLVDMFYPISNYLFLNKYLVLNQGEWWRILTVRSEEHTSELQSH